MIQEEQNIRGAGVGSSVAFWPLNGHEEHFLARKGNAICTLHFWDLHRLGFCGPHRGQAGRTRR